MIRIRPFKPEDFEMICSWWTAAGAVAPGEGMMIEDGTFILEQDEHPMMTVTVFMTQSKKIAYFEGYAANPDRSRTPELGELLFEHCYDYLRARGYEGAIVYAEHEGMKKRYQKFGFNPALSGLSALVRSI